MSNWKTSKPGVVVTIRALAVVLFSSIGLWCIVFPPAVSPAAESVVKPGPTPRRVARRPVKPKYSEFPHDIKAHTMECSSCHKFPSDNWNKVRTGDDAFPDVTEYPKHESCLSCHRQQFFKGAKPAICSICHINPSPRDSRRHPFPNPRELFDASTKGKTAVSDFAISFPHDKHVEIVSQNRSSAVQFSKASWTRSPLQEASCAVCHKTYMPQGDGPDEYVVKPPAKLGDGFWLKRGTFKSIPTSHATCFTCHSQDSGLEPGPNNCAVCHKVKLPELKADFDPKAAAVLAIADKNTLFRWRRRDSSGKFQHAFIAHVDMECSSCHNVATINTLDPMTKKVGIASCATCHVSATSDEGGALNLELDARKSDAKFQCIKCHITFGKLPVPKSHLDALSAAAGN